MRVEQRVRTAATCGPFDKLLDALRRMDFEGLDCLVVVAADASRRPVGLLDARDAARAVGRDPAALADLDVRSAMSGVPAACAPTDSLAEALAVMEQAATERLVVVDAAGRLLGLIGLGDIAAVLAEPGRGAETERIAACRALASRARSRVEGGA